MKKILFPTDFSPAADHAFVYALKLAQKTGASITTIHCYELPAFKGSHLPHTIRKVYESMNLEEFENYKDNIPHLRQMAEQFGLQNIPLDHVLKEGEATYNILKLAKKENVDMVVMGTTGATGLKEIFVGSVAAEIMENAPCPVLAIPKEATFDGKLDRIAFATDYKTEEKTALNWLRNWPAIDGADIFCVHVDLEHTEDLAHKMDRFSADFKGYEKLHFEVIDHSDFEKAITAFLGEKEIDMLAMVSHRRRFLKELFQYSFTKAMAYHLSTPILAIPEKVLSRI